MGRPPKDEEKNDVQVSGHSTADDDVKEPVTPETRTTEKEDKSKDSKMPFTGKVRDLKQYLNEKLDQITEMATLEHKLPLHARIKNRMEAIQKLSSAKHMKIEGHWITTPPQIHISALRSDKINNDEARITFRVYKTDEEGNKILKEHMVKKYSNALEKEVDIVGSANYVVDYEVRETFKSGEPIKREILKWDNPQDAMKR